MHEARQPLAHRAEQVAAGNHGSRRDHCRARGITVREIDEHARRQRQETDRCKYCGRIGAQ